MAPNSEIREQIAAIQKGMRRAGREMVLSSNQALVRWLFLFWTLAAGCGHAGISARRGEGESVARSSRVVQERQGSSAQAGQFSLALGRFFRARGRDLADIPTVRFGRSPLSGIGPLAHADIEATVLAHVGVGYGWANMWGIGDAPTSRVFNIVFGFPFSNLNDQCIREFGWRQLLIFHEHFVECGNNAKGHRCCLCPLLLTLKEHPGRSSRFDLTDLPPIRWGDIEIGTTVYLLFSSRFGISLGEMLDFLGGWFGLDLAGDDEEFREERGWSEAGDALPILFTD